MGGEVVKLLMIYQRNAEVFNRWSLESSESLGAMLKFYMIVGGIYQYKWCNVGGVWCVEWLLETWSTEVPKPY